MPTTSQSASRRSRLLLAAVGVLLVGIGAIGAILPGLPTTIFLLGASWCFARSCPWLEEKLLNNRLFRPFHPWLYPGGRISRRTRAWSIALMWTAITISALLLTLGEDPRFVVAGAVVLLGVVGTWFIAKHKNPSRGARGASVPNGRCGTE
ncbi:MAG: YbaN family protein [Planctomycetota bacterium]